MRGINVCRPPLSRTLSWVIVGVYLRGRGAIQGYTPSPANGNSPLYIYLHVCSPPFIRLMKSGLYRLPRRHSHFASRLGGGLFGEKKRKKRKKRKNLIRRVGHVDHHTDKPPMHHLCGCPPLCAFTNEAFQFACPFLASSNGAPTPRRDHMKRYNFKLFLLSSTTYISKDGENIPPLCHRG